MSHTASPTAAVPHAANIHDTHILRVFLHISDLHVGKPDANTYVPKLPFLQGIRGHDRYAIEDLHDFYSRMNTPATIPLSLLVTGDLTRCGVTTEYSDFFVLLSPIIDGCEPLYVPGNHDHWPGRPFPLGTPATDYNRFLPLCPSIDSVIDICDEVRIRFIRIDSYADVHTGLAAVDPGTPPDVYYNALLARGDFVEQLDHADSALRQHVKPDHEIRILVMHHSIFLKHYGVGEITEQSMTRLWEFIKAHNVRVVLTGHAHWPTVSRGSYEGHTIVECRSGTTCQKIPLQEGLVNALIVHELAKRDRTYIWRPKVYWRTLFNGFEPWSHKDEAEIVLLTL